MCGAPLVCYKDGGEWWTKSHPCKGNDTAIPIECAKLRQKGRFYAVFALKEAREKELRAH
jgi:hypothetical protein